MKQLVIGAGMRGVLLFITAVMLSGCAMSAYNPHFIVSEAKTETVEEKE